jgi:hypothetical protein
VRSTIRLSSSEPGYPDRAWFIQKIVTVTRPAPVFRFLDETSRDWIAVHVLQLFDPFVVGEDIEVVVAGLPEGFRAESLRDRKLEGMDCFRERDLAVQRFTDEKMDVLGHDDVAEDFEVMALAGEFEGVEEDVS